MIRSILSIVITTLFLMLVSCGKSGDISGTGHGGEAIVIGVALTNEGSPAADKVISLALDSYSLANENRKQYETITDSNGNFSFAITESGEFTLSSKDESDFLYQRQVKVSVDSLTTMGTMTFTPGVEVTLFPWWESSAKPNYLCITGTSWSFQLSDSTQSSFILPEQELSFVRYSNDFALDSITLDLKETKVIGNDQLSHSSSIVIPENVRPQIEFTAKITSFTKESKLYIDWGDKSDIQAITAQTINHSYKKSGFYLILLYKKSESGVLSKIPIDIAEVVVSDKYEVYRSVTK